MATFFVDGDKGGVGKSFMARALADYLITSEHCKKLVIIDCDPANPDVVGGEAYASGVVNGIEIVAERKPIKDNDNWMNIIDFALREVTEFDSKADCVFSLPAGAGLHINHETIEMQALLQPALTVWVMGNDKSSVSQLEERIEKSPSFYSRGIIALNLYHGQVEKGAFSAWYNSDIYPALAEKWPEVFLPRINPFGIEIIGNKPFHVMLDNRKITPTVPIVIKGFRRQLHPQLDKAFEALGI